MYVYLLCASMQTYTNIFVYIFLKSVKQGQTF